MRVVFAGTPAFAVPCLQALFAAAEEGALQLVGIFTAPDRRRGRGQVCGVSAVKESVLAQRKNPVPIFQPDSFADESAVAQLVDLKPDLMVVAAYGLLLPEAALAIPRLGCVNLHASLLPRWRGAAPVARAIEAGDKETGISLMRMERRLDHGPVLAERKIDIAADDTTASLTNKLATLAGELLADNLPALAAGTLSATPQDESRACYAPKLEKAEATIDWRLDANTLERKVRAFIPWPVARARLLHSDSSNTPARELRILRTAVVAGSPPTETRPGEIISTGREGITVATGNDYLQLLEIQKPGGRPMSAAALTHGATITPGMGFACED